LAAKGNSLIRRIPLLALGVGMVPFAVIAATFFILGHLPSDLMQWGAVILIAISLTGVIILWLKNRLRYVLQEPIIEATREIATIKGAKDKLKADYSIYPELQEFVEGINRAIKRTHERRHALEAQAKEKDELSLALSQLKRALDEHAIVTITDVDGTITYVNELMCETSEFSREELVGANHRIMKSGVHDREFYIRMYSKLVNGEIWSGTLCNKTKSGKLFWLDTTIVPFTNASGEIDSYIAIRTDVSDRVRHLQRAEQSEAAYRKLFEHSDICIWDEDFRETWKILQKLKKQGVKDLRQHLHDNPETLQALEESVRVKNVNKATLELFEAKSHAVLLERIGETFGEDAEEVFIREMEAIWHGYEDFSAEANFVSLTGKPFTCIISLPVPKSYEDCASIPVSMIDISERKQIEARLISHKERLNEAERVAGIGNFEFDADTMYWSSSKGLNRIIEIDEQYPRTYQSFLKLVHPYNRRSLLVFLELCIEERRERFEYEFRVNGHLSGATKWVRTVCNITYDEDDKVTRFSGTVQDITEIKKAEQIQIRTQKMEALGHLTGGIAHDFNNILGIILGNLELLQRRVNHGHPQLSRRVDAALKGVERAKRLTSQLLGFSRAKAMEVESTCVDTFLKEIEEVLRHATLPNVSININCDDKLGYVEVDRDDFENAMLNLMINANDAIRLKGNVGTIDIRVSRVTLDRVFCEKNYGAKPGDYVRLSISDSGIGMDEQTQSQIFDPFFTTKKRGEGTGLGLSQVFGFVKRSGGYIKVYSEPGIGSTFILYLPVATSTSNANPKKTKNDSPEIPIRGRGRILLVDDETSLLEVSKTYLMELGFTVDLANNAEQALELLKRGIKYDLVCSDIVMPGQYNGHELANQILNLSPTTKILLTSGFTSEVALKNKLTDKRFPLLTKPYTQRELAIRITQLLESVDKTNNRLEIEMPEWREKLSTGIDEIDNDHKAFFEFIKQSLDVSQAERQLEAINTIIDHLIRHFALEEVIMQESDCPFYASHKQMHRYLLTRIIKKRAQFKENEIDYSHIMKFIMTWLTDHIQFYDAELASVNIVLDENTQQKIRERIKEINGEFS